MWNMAPQTIAIEAKAVPKKLTTPRQRTCFAFKYTLHTQFHFHVRASIIEQKPNPVQGSAHTPLDTGQKTFFSRLFLDNFLILEISCGKVGAK
jgi:hypothetical protein